jgi:hypothetical protein
MHRYLDTTMVALRLRPCGAESVGMTRMLTAGLVALLITASPAYASGKGGDGGGGGAPAPTPTPAPVFVDPCDGYFDVSYTDGSSAIVNRTSGGCVIVRAWPSGALTLDFVVLVPGWTYTIENGGGTKGRVQLSFSNPTTGEKASIRVEPGKTDIR